MRFRVINFMMIWFQQKNMKNIMNTISKEQRQFIRLRVYIILNFKRAYKFMK